MEDISSQLRVSHLIHFQIGVAETPNTGVTYEEIFAKKNVLENT